MQAESFDSRTKWLGGCLATAATTTGTGHAAKSARARAKSDLPSTAAVRRRNCIIASRQFVTFLGAASRDSEPASKESLWVTAKHSSGIRDEY